MTSKIRCKLLFCWRTHTLPRNHTKTRSINMRYDRRYTTRIRLLLTSNENHYCGTTQLENWIQVDKMQPILIGYVLKHRSPSASVITANFCTCWSVFCRLNRSSECIISDAAMAYVNLAHGVKMIENMKRNIYRKWAFNILQEFKSLQPKEY